MKAIALGEHPVAHLDVVMRLCSTNIADFTMMEP